MKRMAATRQAARFVVLQCSSSHIPSSSSSSSSSLLTASSSHLIPEESPGAGVRPSTMSIDF